VGCGARPSPDALAEAAAQTAEAGTASIESVTEFKSEGRSTTFRSHGVVDYGRDRYDTTDQYDGMSARVIAIGDTSYVAFAGMDWPPAWGKRWLRVDTDDGGAAEAHACDEAIDSGPDDPASDGGEGGMVNLYGFSSGVNEYSDPGQVLGYLSDVDAEVQLLGRELVRREATTHYHAKVDQRRALRHDLESHGWSPHAIDCAVSSQPQEPLDIDAWVDDVGLVRRLVTTATVRLGRSDSTWVVTTDFFDFGAPVQIDAPPADEVVSYEDWSKFAEP
jgi:hypothetical protein